MSNKLNPHRERRRQRLKDYFVDRTIVSCFLEQKVLNNVVNFYSFCFERILF